MNTQDAIARFSPDGRVWDLGGGETEPLNWARDERVTRLVIGNLENDGAARQTLAGFVLPDDLADRFPRLTHLHLWRCSGISALPALPQHLLELDLRGCTALVQHPELPGKLELLDVGDCRELKWLRNLPSTVQRCYVNGCVKLHNFEPPSKLVEFDATGWPALTSLSDLPASVEKLVLSRCAGLTDLSALGSFDRLRHLDLTDCPRITDLPTVPDTLQYLALHGSDQLNTFGPQDIGPYERGTPEHPNVAPRLAVRKAFADHLDAALQAKLLLLGDGRVGKTTLSKALQWYSLSQADRDSGPYDDLRPDAEEPFTHSIRYANWDTRFTFGADVAEDLNRRADAAGLEPICDSAQSAPGRVRIWDFAGQELYHQTHRVFAAEGSVFVIVWSRDADSAVRGSCPDGMAADLWAEMNRSRSLDYWFDYVDAIRPDAQIVLVCTQWRHGERPQWCAADSLHRDRDGVRCFYVDSLEPGDLRDPHNEFARLMQHLSQRLGEEARRIGVIQPRIYTDANARLDDWLAENDQARRDPDPCKRPAHLNMAWGDWETALCKMDTSNVLKHAESDAVTVGITATLHDKGALFHWSAGEDSSIILDQSWLTVTIYELLRPPAYDAAGMDCLFSRIRHKNGFFDSDDFNASPEWNGLAVEHRELVTGFMLNCGLMAGVDDEPGVGRHAARYLATQKWLLPPRQDLAKQFEQLYRHTIGLADFCSLELDAAYQRVSEFDWRALMGRLARRLQGDVQFHRTGVQSRFGTTRDVTGCLDAVWVPLEGDSSGYYGRVRLRLTARSDDLPEYQRDLESLLTEGGVPFADGALSWVTHPPDHRDVSYYRDPLSREYDLAVSSSGSDKAVVCALVEQAQASGLSVYWYGTEQTRPEERTLPLMQALSRQEVLLVCVSDAYLDTTDPSKFYCLYELAYAILCVHEGTLDNRRVVVVFRRDGDSDRGVEPCDFQTRTHCGVKTLADHFHSLFMSTDAVANKTTNEIQQIFSRVASVQAAQDTFFREHSNYGRYLLVNVDAESEPDPRDLSNIINKVNDILGQA